MANSTKSEQISRKQSFFHTLHSKPSHLRVFWTSKPAITPIVVGKEAAQTPSLFKVFSSIPDATTKGGAHCLETDKQQEME